MEPKEWQANSGEQPYAESEQHKQYRSQRPRFQSQGRNRDYHGYNRENRDGQDYRQSGYRSQAGYNRNDRENPVGRDQQRTRSNYGERSEQQNFRARGRQQNGFHKQQRHGNRHYNPTRQINYEELPFDPTKPMRLNKFLANAGICSRREADEFIQAGVVSVNGNVVTELGTKITAADRVMFHDQLVQMERKVYILLNKPKDCVTTAEDTHARTTVLDIIKGACQERVYPVGRLDRNTTGVLLLTNDGELATRLTHPKFNKKKIYHVKLDRELTDEDRQQLLQGIEIEPELIIKADAVEFVKDDDLTQVGVEIHSGQNRVVRRMFEKLAYRIIKLDRVFFAGLTKKNLARGKWRFLTQKEVNMLQMGAFE